jgi:hypothetical protein
MGLIPRVDHTLQQQALTQKTKTGSMKNFKEMGIKPALHSLTGQKIQLFNLLNREVIVYDYRIEDSKFSGGGKKCLYMQLELEGIKRVAFTGASALIETIQQIPKTDFPFKTTIVKNNERYEFS